MIDNRVGLKDVMIQSLCNDLTHEITIELLIRVNSEMADSDQTVKLAGIYSSKNNNASKQKPVINGDTPIKNCYNFNESGECRFGASCIYSHAKDPDHTTREPRVKPISKPSSHPPIPVNRDNKAPSGGEKYRGGYKSKPKARFNMINASDENTSLKIININNEVSTLSQ